MRTSIATVCLSGTLEEKLFAAHEAGFDGVEIFEQDLVASPLSPEKLRERASDLQLTLDLYQPFRDFEGVGAEALGRNLRRAGAKFTLMNRLGIDTMLLCSNVATARSSDQDLAAAQLHQLGDLAEKFNVRVAYEALAWGRFVDGYEQAAQIVRNADHDRIGLCLDSFHILSKNHSLEAIETIPADQPVAFVDMAGNPDLRTRLHRHFGGQLVYSGRVGLTHQDAAPDDNALPGAKPTWFFAPDQIRKRAKEWGPGGIDQRFGAVWSGFTAAMGPKLDVIESRGSDAVQQVYLDTLKGRVKPAQAHMLSMAD